MNLLNRRLARLEARHGAGQCSACGVSAGGPFVFAINAPEPPPVPCSTCHRPLRFTFLIANANGVGVGDDS